MLMNWKLRLKEKKFRLGFIVGIGVVIFIGVSFLFDKQSSVVTYSDKVPDNIVYEDDSSNTDSIKIYLYHQYGPDMYVDSKTVTGGTASNIISLLNQLEETGEIEETISDEEVDLDSFYIQDYPVDGGTMWVEAEGTLYRFGASGGVSRVEKPLGEGVVLKYIAECWEEIHHAWYFWPYDYWGGTYENGVLKMSHSYAGESSVSATVKDIYVEKRGGSIQLELVSDKTQIVKVHWDSYSGDQLGTNDSRSVLLFAGQKSNVTLPFDGFKYGCSLEIKVGNTVLDILIRTEY